MKVLLFCLLAVGAYAAPSRRPSFPRGYSQIVGGSDATSGEFPYQLSFQDTSYGMKFHFCGASVYNKNTAICAGHCVYGENYNTPKNLQVVAGEYNLAKKSGKEQERKVVKIVLHEDYNSRKFYNDISLLQTSSPFNFNDMVQPISLPKQGQTTTGKCTVTGWGTLYSGGPTPDVLQKVDVTVVSDKDCRAAYGSSSIIDSMLCAGDDGKDSCQGDSGGPLACHGYLGGIVSWGYGCADKRYPGVYTEVAYFVDWIHKHEF